MNHYMKNHKRGSSKPKFYEKQLGSEFYFTGIKCTVVRNPSDGRRRIQCPDNVGKRSFTYKATVCQNRKNSRKNLIG